MIHYGFSKSADLALMRGFAQALAASGVTVNAVLPGPTRTEGVEEMFKSMGWAGSCFYPFSCGNRATRPTASGTR